ncbi:MAG: 2-oxoacid:acceptor oxidoreductase family protein [Candidatus Rokubacteria bacterium]|nr:2-oxoacid:acceptor oxidoreductase family protein [Candidatus Rokubacteria bacterium]
MLRVPRDCHVVMTGIGGTGVVTLNQILGTAALIDGRHVRGLDQTGLSQKNGPVVSHLKITDGAPDFSNKVASGGADCYLALDLLVATAPGNLDRARPERTVAVISTSEVATGAMVASPDVRFPDRGGLLATLNRVTRKDDNVVLDAVALAEALFDNHMMANPIVLGTAYQAGAIPVSAAAIEQAFRLNGVAVEANTQAFRAGRRAVADPAWAVSLRVRAGDR